jgi:hypothetical protein
MTRSPRRPLPGLLLLLTMTMLAGCYGGDDFARPGTWSATGANETNLRAMAANPADLQRGVTAGPDRGQQGSLAVSRLQADRRKPLPDTRASRVGAALVPVATQDVPNGR